MSKEPKRSESEIKGKRPSASIFISSLPSGLSPPGRAAGCGEKTIEFRIREPEPHPQFCQEGLIHLIRHGDLSELEVSI